MFKNRRFVIAIFIILLGTGVSLWILGSKAGNKGIASLFEIAGLGADSGRFAMAEGISLNSGSSENNLDGSENITNKILDRYTQEIFKANKSGVGVGTGSQIAIPNETVLENIMGEELSKGLAIKLFETKDIKISEDSSKEAALAYVENLQKANASNSKKDIENQYFAAIENAVSEQGTEMLQEYLNAISQRITALLAITAPSNLASFHLGLINAWQKRLAVGKAIIESSGDIMKPLAAIEMLNGVIEEEEQLIKAFENTLANIPA